MASTCTMMSAARAPVAFRGSRVSGARITRSAPFAHRSRCQRLQVNAAADAPATRFIPKWDTVYGYLVRAEDFRTVSPEDAKQLADAGEYVIVDVRPAPVYKQAHIPGSVNVPLYQPLDWGSGNVAQKFVKFVAYSFNGVTPIEPNVAFAEQLRAATANGTKGIITACEAGGTLKPSTNFPLGKSSRSLQAAYKAMAEQVTSKVLHLDRGIYGWYQSDLGFEGEGDYTPEIGRTPSAVAEPTLELLKQSQGYEIRAGDRR